MESTQFLSSEALAPASKMQPDQAVLEKAADSLIASESPLIVTKYLGRNPDAVPLLVELAELLALPVVQQLSYVNFPTDHPLYLGVQAVKYVRQADLLFFIDTDVPWEPSSRYVLLEGVQIIHVERDPMFTAIIRAKLAANPAMHGKLEERRKKIEGEHNQVIQEMDESVEAVKKQKPIHPAWLSRCI